MRVAFDVGQVRDQPTGVGVFASAMASALADELGPSELAFIGRRPGGPELPAGFATTPLSPGNYALWMQLGAARDIRRVRADIGHFGDGVVPVVRVGRTVVSVHDMSVVRTWRTHRARRLLKVPLILLAPRLADLVLVPSRATADEVVALTGVSPRKIELMPYAPQRPLAPATGPQAEAILASYGLSPGSYILALGTIEPRKNLIRLAEAFERLAAAGSMSADMQLVVAGDPRWGSGPILDRLRESTVASRIRTLGYVPGEAIAPLLSGAAAVAYPSLYEGFGLPVVEAMACGAPTVTSNLSSMPEVAGDAAFLVDPYDPADIARGLEEAVRAGATDRERVTAAAMAQAATFTWARAARTAAELYRTKLR